MREKSLATLTELKSVFSSIPFLTIQDEDEEEEQNNNTYINDENKEDINTKKEYVEEEKKEKDRLGISGRIRGILNSFLNKKLEISKSKSRIECDEKNEDEDDVNNKNIYENINGNIYNIDEYNDSDTYITCSEGSSAEDEEDDEDKHEYFLLYGRPKPTSPRRVNKKVKNKNKNRILNSSRKSESFQKKKKEKEKEKRKIKKKR